MPARAPCVKGNHIEPTSKGFMYARLASHAGLVCESARCSDMLQTQARRTSSPSKLPDFTNVSEGSCHDNGGVLVLLVVLVNALDRLHTRVLHTSNRLAALAVQTSQLQPLPTP